MSIVNGITLLFCFEIDLLHLNTFIHFEKITFCLPNITQKHFMSIDRYN